ncbi:MAG: cobyric acid synthase [Desulfamplus sp.]|nr:cobyric acid synthase [Desulfamplus sp.]
MKKKMKPLAILGTGSDVGKSVVAAAICRYLADMGVSVAPFKAQNMSNNSGITPEGLEMGRAQIVQAEAARIAPHVDMNPVLLKPTGEKGSQVVLNGVAFENSTALSYHSRKDYYFKAACDAFDRLQQRFEMIVLEGAGSCAEVNLMPSDIVNFRMAEYADADVILVADIHRGGVFGQIVGTLECLPQKYHDMIKGFIINRFRGDIELFKDGVKWIEERTCKKVLGVLPWYSHIKIDAEDSVEIEKCPSISSIDFINKPAIAVIKLKHISNFTDFHALSESVSNLNGAANSDAINSSTPEIRVVFIDTPIDLARFQAVIIPGSKNTRSDIAWLKETGWDKKIKDYAKSAGHTLGICGGYQILGEYVDDPEGLEGEPGRTEGLNLLPVQTVLKAPKTTTLSRFSWEDVQGEGYEIHMGQTCLVAHTDNVEFSKSQFMKMVHDKGKITISASPMFQVHERNRQPCSDYDGAVSQSGNICGTYMHGLFDSWGIRKKWLEHIGVKGVVSSNLSDNSKSNIALDRVARKNRDYELLKEHFLKYVDINTVVFNQNREIERTIKP